MQVFKTYVLKNERGVTYIEVPFDPDTVFGKKKRHAISGSLSGIPFQGTLGVKEGKYRFPLNKALQLAGGVKAGDEIEVEMRAEVENTQEVPQEIQSVLNAHEKANAFFISLSPFYRNSYIKWILEAKSEATREKRLQEMIALLIAHKKQK